ncbi:FAD-dependent oxidoreductase [Mesorhizobium sp. M0134]|uniref:GMC family oxidoreductase n=1 Tax=Mesorhizobium sp. M0134 TaxID=2956889 RepID=UPI00333E07AD
MVDFIVVGGGSAGCVVASRLSENPDVSVLLLEQGPRDNSPYIHMPVTYYKTAQGNLLQRFEQVRSEADKHLGAQTMVQPRVLGGGSSVNAMLYIRGAPDDYERWVEQGATGWSYKEVLPFFKRSEDNDRLSNEAHGEGGPLGVSDPCYVHPLSRSWLKACQEAGLAFNADFNSGEQAGCGFYQLTIRNARRSSAAVAFLKPAQRRSNLKVRTDCRVLRIVFKQGRAVGVEIADGQRTSTIYADREVIISAGAINSPHLLMLSGVGPAAHLRSCGVDVVHDLPGVGQNLCDHVDIYMTYQLSGPYSYDRYKSPLWQSWAGLEYLLFRRGPVTSNVMDSGAFWSSSQSTDRPDIQYIFLCGSGIESGAPVPGGFGCTLNATHIRPKSRGWLGLRSSDPARPPHIVPNYLSEPSDLGCLVEAVQRGQEIMSQKALSKYIEREHMPGKQLMTKADYEQYIRQYAQSSLHPSGTCRMGTDDLAVLDPELRVRGLDGLRVIDASAMPSVVSGNTNAPTIMIGERGADFILRSLT